MGTNDDVSNPQQLGQKRWNYCNAATAGRHDRLFCDVAEVERRLSAVEELEAVVSANLQRAVRLRQSILQKAFTGELTGGATCKDGLQVQTKGR